MDPLSAIAGLAQTIDAAINAGRVMTGTSNALSQAQLKDQLANVLNALADAKMQLANLKMAELERAERKSRRDGYALIQTPVGTFVYESKTEPKHFACPNCMDGADQVQILQPRGSYEYSGAQMCPGCEKAFAIKPAKQLPQPVREDWIGAFRR